MFILDSISISIFVKLIQEYRGGAYIYSGGKWLNHQRPKMALTTLESFFIYIVVHVIVHLPSSPFSIHVMTHFNDPCYV